VENSDVNGVNEEAEFNAGDLVIKSDFGCYIGANLASAFAYANDIMLVVRTMRRTISLVRRRRYAVGCSGSVKKSFSYYHSLFSDLCH
jgi:hypothetical protein